MISEGGNAWFTRSLITRSRIWGGSSVKPIDRKIENCWNNNRMLCTINLLVLDSKLDLIRFIK